MTGGRWVHAPTMSLQQRRSKHLLHPLHACTCRGERNSCARGASGNAALLDYGGEQAQVGQIEMHGTTSFGLPFLPMLRPKAGLRNYSFCFLETGHKYSRMPNLSIQLGFVAAAFLLSGLV